jgi:RNA recognition motif-containing protein
MTNIFIANLDWEITSEDLMTTFSSFGKVNYAHVVFDAKTKRSKGFGYVEMIDTDSAINAIQALNGMEINGRKLDVKIASPKSNRPKKVEKPVSDEVKKPFSKPFQKKPFQKRDGSKPFNKPYNKTGESKPYHKKED